MIKLFILYMTCLLPSSDLQWLKDNVKTSYQLEYVMMSYEYKNDEEGQNWEDLSIALQRGEFDCEEAGMLVYDILTYNGYKCVIYYVTDWNKGHVITSYERGKDKGYFSFTNRHKDRGFTIEKYIKNTKYIEWEEVINAKIN